MEIAVNSDDDAELNSLYQWLTSDGDVTAGAGLRLGSSGRRTGYQSPLDVVDVVLSNAIALANLLIAYAAWRGTRPSRPSITVTIDGAEITVSDADDETIKRVTDLARSKGALPAAAEAPAE